MIYETQWDMIHANVTSMLSVILSCYLEIVLHNIWLNCAACYKLVWTILNIL